MDNQKYWLGFSLISGIGTKNITKLVNWFGDLAIAWSASGADLQAAGLHKKAIENLLKAKKSINLDAELERVHQAGATLFTIADERYPALLKDIEGPPPVLYARGTLLEQDNRAISIVGTRKATRYGCDAALDISWRLAKQGITIISGLAHGIDAAAHQGAIKAKGRTLAVMGCGIDIIYPQDNYRLAQEIMAQGALISEFPLGTHPAASNFPQRNRIISGLSLGVLVVEAPENSGALITADLAAEQGREVFAIPSNIFNQLGRGTNRLIQDGAKLIMDVDDILNELDIVYTHVQTKNKTKQAVPANDTENLLLQHMSVDPIHIDDLIRLSQLSTAEVNSTLTILELKGVAQMVGHMQYSLAINID